LKAISVYEKRGLINLLKNQDCSSHFLFVIRPNYYPILASNIPEKYGLAVAPVIQGKKMVSDNQYIAVITEESSIARKAAENAEKSKEGNNGVYVGAAICLHDGKVITGKNSPLMHSSSSLMLNTIKYLADLPDSIDLISRSVIDSIRTFKTNILNTEKLSVNLEEMLIALSISAATNPSAQVAMERLRDIRGTEVHMTHIPSLGDEVGWRKLGVNLTTDPQFAGTQLFIN